MKLFWRKRYHVTKRKDGSIKRIRYDLDYAFPLVFPNRLVDLSGEAKIMDELKVEGKVQYAKAIDTLVFAINDLNSNLQLSFRAAYVAYWNEPDKNEGYFERLVSGIIEQQHHLKMCEVLIRGLIGLASILPPNSDQFGTEYIKIMERIGAPLGPQVTQQRIEEAKRVTEEILGGKNES